MDSPPIRFVSDEELRALFNASGYEALLQNGVLVETIVADRHPSSNKAGEAPCARSQLIGYRDEAGVILARVYRYLRSDGTLGASGRPDPKFLLYEGVIYKQA
jgi:hypothetical protein